LAANFRREPIPASPTHSTRDASASKIGSTAPRAVSGPEARIVSSPCSAGCVLPETGASTSLTACA
jgi:hypothetical protein